jgi:hypothetical protein
MPDKTVLVVAAALSSMLLPCMGSAEDATPLRQGPWPIRDGHNHQPTERDLRNLNMQDVTPREACDIDRLYDELLADDSEKARRRRPTSGHRRVEDDW